VIVVAVCALPVPEAEPPMLPESADELVRLTATVTVAVRPSATSFTVQVAVPLNVCPAVRLFENVVVALDGLVAVKPGVDHE
jgi:hypothetical protein